MAEEKVSVPLPDGLGEDKDGPTQGKENDPAGTVTPQKLQAKKIGHRRVDKSTGQTTYKKTPSSALSGSIQLGISHTVAGLSAKPERDVLMQDFQVVETISFPVEGTNITPAHHYEDFTFRTYAPTAFRYFRDLFGIQPDDYMLSISQHPLTELSNPGASGSLFFVTHDDKYIIKTVQHKEAEFLQKLLPGYYMNLVQNPKTFLPKFYGLYCVQASGKNIRVCVMNNLMPRKIKMHLKYDLKGSTYKRKASKHERSKKNPTYKDLDLLNDMPGGVLLDPEIHIALIKTIQRDCLVLQSFKIMDYSMLLAIHRLDNSDHDKRIQETKFHDSVATDPGVMGHSRQSSSDYNSDASAPSTSGYYGPPAALNPAVSSTLLRNNHSQELDHWSGGIPAKSNRGEKLLLFCGIIDILQCYKLKKKIEHTWKSVIADGDTVSVHRPAFYCQRFQTFMENHVYKKTIVKTQPSSRNRQSTRKTHSATAPSENSKNSTATSSAPLSRLQGRPDLVPKDEFERPKSGDEQVTSPEQVAVDLPDTNHSNSIVDGSAQSKTDLKDPDPPSKMEALDSNKGEILSTSNDVTTAAHHVINRNSVNGEGQLEISSNAEGLGDAVPPSVKVHPAKDDTQREHGTAF